MGMNKIKATVDRTTRTHPWVRVLAYEINNDATTMSPMATKDAHILSKLDIFLTPYV